MVGDLDGLAEAALALRRLLLEDVARERMTATDLALGGQLEALLRARMGLHLRHDGRGSMTKKLKDPGLPTDRTGHGPTNPAACAVLRLHGGAGAGVPTPRQLRPAPRQPRRQARDPDRQRGLRPSDPLQRAPAPQGHARPPALA